MARALLAVLVVATLSGCDRIEFGTQQAATDSRPVDVLDEDVACRDGVASAGESAVASLQFTGFVIDDGRAPRRPIRSDTWVEGRFQLTNRSPGPLEFPAIERPTGNLVGLAIYACEGEATGRQVSVSVDPKAHEWHAGDPPGEHVVPARLLRLDPDRSIDVFDFFVPRMFADPSRHWRACMADPTDTHRRICSNLFQVRE
jgi:hypothetical protein